MNIDIRLKLSFQSHPKTKKLRLKLGNDGVLSFVWLMMFAAANKPDGCLDGMDHEDIALAADWNGDPDEFVEVLLAVRYLIKNGTDLFIHDWQVHNAYAAKAGERSAQATKAAATRWEKKRGVTTEDQTLIHEKDADSKDEQCAEDESAMRVASNSNAPDPSPDPSPDPDPDPLPDKRRRNLKVSSGHGEAEKGDDGDDGDDSKEPKSTANYANWIPTDSTLKRLKKALPGITDEFIQNEIPEFLIHAEEHYQRDQLQAKFFANVERHFKRQATPEHQSTVPKGSPPQWFTQIDGSSQLIDDSGKVLRTAEASGLDALVTAGAEAQQG